MKPLLCITYFQKRTRGNQSKTNRERTHFYMFALTSNYDLNLRSELIYFDVLGFFSKSDLGLFSYDLSKNVADTRIE